MWETDLACEYRYVEKIDEEIIANLLNELDDRFEGQASKYYTQNPLFKVPILTTGASIGMNWENCDENQSVTIKSILQENIWRNTATVHGVTIS